MDTPSAVASPARPASPAPPDAPSRGRDECRDEEPPPPPQPAAPTEALPPPRYELEELRREIFELAASDTLDKGAALAVTRLFHAMETLLRHECAERERRLSRALNDIEQMRLHNELERLARRHTLDDLQQQGAAPPADGRRRTRHF